jgi:hypothetical protein
MRQGAAGFAALFLLAVASAAGAEPAPPTLSQIEAQTLEPRALARRLFPDLAPQDAVRATTSRGRFTPPGALGAVAVYSRPTDLGGGVCRTVRHQRRATHKLGPAAREAPVPTASTAMPLEPAETQPMLFILPVSGPAAAPCADQDPALFFGLGRPQMEADAVVAARHLRAAVADGAPIPFKCYDPSTLGRCDDPAAALRSLKVDEVDMVRSDSFCVAMTPGSTCLMFIFKDTPPGTWIVDVTVNKGEMTGLKLDRGAVSYD